jgi:hypothetical protein
MDAELRADFLDQGLLAVATGVFELLEQVLDLAMVGLQEGNGVRL